MQKWLGERQVQRLAAHGYQIINEDYESTVAIPRNRIEDDTFGVFTLDVRGAGSMAAKWPDDMVLETLINAEALNCYDGQYYFDTDHPVDPYDSAKGTYSNLKTSRALNATNYALTRREMRLFKNDNGRYANVSPNLLVVPPQLEDVAKTILSTDVIANATLEGQTQVGAVNNIYKNTAEILVIEELGDYPADWYLLDTRRAIKPFVHQVRKAVNFQAYFSPSDPNLFFHKEYLFGADSRGAAGVTLPILATKCKG
jgi:phage major head subunit gpT-like protein